MSFTITCPICGKRNAYEFRFGGEDRGPRPDFTDISADAWCDWVHMRTTAAGPQKEWWYHRDGCGKWFTIWRNTLTNREVPESEVSS